jgi:hypothetical protein
MEYRVVSDPSWRVEVFHKGKWIVAYYCSSEDGAKRRMKKCQKEAEKWSKMTKDERMASILR